MRVPSQAALRRGELAWGARPDAVDRPRMRLLSFKPMVKGALRGFSTVELPIGLKLIDCPIFVGTSGASATLPSKPVVSRDGKRCRPDGRPQFAAILEWRDRQLSDRFSAAVVELVRAAHPDAFA
jgi:hypothetical protein